MVDFSLSHFLDRFAFKNPKKDNPSKAESLVQSLHNKNYTPHGSRGHSVMQLNSTNCSEDERFIFQYLNQKRERRAALGLDKNQDDDEIDDDEFDSYLDSLAGKGKDKEANADDEDFVGDLEQGLKKPKKSKRSTGNDDDNEDWDSESDDQNDDDDDDIDMK